MVKIYFRLADLDKGWESVQKRNQRYQVRQELPLAEYSSLGVAISWIDPVVAIWNEYCGNVGGLCGNLSL